MKQEKNTVQFSEIRSKGCNDIEMLERFLHGIVWGLLLSGSYALIRFLSNAFGRK